MRILHVLDHSIPLQSGYTFRTRAILRAQRARGWTTEHVTSAKHPFQGCLEETVDDLHFFRMPALPNRIARTPLLNQLAVSAQLRRQLARIIEYVSPDIIHAHSPVLNGLAALGASRRSGLPLVYEVRAFWEDAAVDHGTARDQGARYRLTRALESHVLRRADAITTICEGLRGEIVSRGVPASKVVVVPNAVDAQTFAFDPPKDHELAARLELTGRVVLGFIGSFYAYEGLPLLLRAFHLIADRHPEIRLLLVGGGPEAERVNDLVVSLGLRGRVIVTGRVPHDQVGAHYSLIDVAVYPRLRMRLTDLVTPLKPLEAMAQGCPVLASNVGGHRELIRDGQNGVLFDAGDADALAEAIESLVNNQNLRADMKTAGRDFVVRERTWDHSIAGYADIYERLTEHPVAA